MVKLYLSERERLRRNHLLRPGESRGEAAANSCASHKNLRYTTQVDTINRFMSFDKETMFPRLPIAGLRVEF